MATIGTFVRSKDGYSGTIDTLTVTKKVRIVANDNKQNENAPDFRIFGPKGELGAAWRQKTSDDTPRDYLSVVLDDPFLPAPIRAALFENEEEGRAVLVCNRERAA